MLSKIEAPFKQHSDAIVAATIEIRRADQEGVDPDPNISRVSLALNLGDASPEEVRQARLAEAHLNVGARVVARAANLMDTQESGGFPGVIARVELFLTKLIERKYLEDALTPGGPVDRVRGKITQ